MSAGLAWIGARSSLVDSGYFSPIWPYLAARNYVEGCMQAAKWFGAYLGADNWRTGYFLTRVALSFAVASARFRRQSAHRHRRPLVGFLFLRWFLQAQMIPRLPEPEWLPSGRMNPDHRAFAKQWPRMRLRLFQVFQDIRGLPVELLCRDPAMLQRGFSSN